MYLMCHNLRRQFWKGNDKSSLSIHLRADKIYQDLKKSFLWSGLKIDVAQFVYSCMTCHKSEIEHHKLSGLMQPLDIPE